MPSVSSKTCFKVLQKFDLDYAPYVITKYESERTGMSVVVVDREGPKVNGVFTLATEIHDDSGAPHTLEHLCFMGSKNYPYKGVLDKLATRAYSNTNAWTAGDHTAYTLDTAGWEGFAQILPIYLEHILFPTLTNTACYTEVHHVDGSGHDAGVVYSEMQGVQNTQAELLDLKTKRLLYPENIGYRYETGGMMEQLRVLTPDRIRQFHREMYQPKNLCLILIGTIDHANLLDILENFETSIVNDIPRLDAPFKRPWVESDPTPPLQKSVTETVEFPEEDESTGEIAISFFGPKCNDLIQGESEIADENALFLDFTDMESVTALTVLLVYLAGSSASVLENILVEKECVASAVYYATEIRPDVVIQLSLSGVATERLAEVEARFFDIIKETAAKELDLVYLKNCIKRERLQVMSSAETSTTPFLEPIIYDFLFAARDGSQLRADLESLKEYDELDTWTDSNWRQLLRKWVSDAHHVTVVGKPSAKLSEKLKAEETARIAARKESLGVHGLETKERRLARAKAQNDREIPEDLLRKFKVPTTKSINFIKTTTVRSGLAKAMDPLDNRIQQLVDQDSSALPKSINFIKTTTVRSGLAKAMDPLDNRIQQLVDQDSSALPLFVQFEHIPSNFAHLILVISTEPVPVALRPLLPLYIDNFFTSPIWRNNQRVEFEQVIMELEKDTVSYGISLGHEIGNPEVLCLRMQVETAKYASAVQWLKDIIWNGIFDAERLLSTTTRLLADIPEAKRSGSDMLGAIEEMLSSAPPSVVRAHSTLVKAVYLKGVKRQLGEDPKNIMYQLEELRHSLFDFFNPRVLVIADVEKLSNPVSTWNILAPKLGSNKAVSPLETRLSRLSEAGRNPGSLSYIVPMPTIDSSYALSVAKGPSTLRDPRIPALMVAFSYLDAVEGPLWTAVRGTGLAYGTNFGRHTESGQISFSVYRSPNALKAFETCKNVVEGLASAETELEPSALEGAVTSIVLGFANAQSTMAMTAQMSFVRQVIMELPSEWNDLILAKIREVRVSEIKKTMKDVILPAFDATTANLIITCAPVMEEELMKGFRKLGFNPEVRALAYFQDDYGMTGGSDSDLTEDEEDERGDECEDEE